MKCGWFGDLEEIENCDNEATHDQNCTQVMGVPVCAQHTCRCSVTLEERARRDEAKRVKEQARLDAAAQRVARAREADALVREWAQTNPWYGATDGWRCRHCSSWAGSHGEFPVIVSSDVEFSIAQHSTTCLVFRAVQYVSGDARGGGKK